VLDYLVQQETFFNVGSHPVPDGCSLWKAEENQVTLTIHHHPALPRLLPPRCGGSGNASSQSPAPDGATPDMAAAPHLSHATVGHHDVAAGEVGSCTFRGDAGHDGGVPHPRPVPEVHLGPPDGDGLPLPGHSHGGAHPCVPPPGAPPE